MPPVFVTLDQAREQIAALGERSEKTDLRRAPLSRVADDEEGGANWFVEVAGKPTLLTKSAVTDLVSMTGLPTRFLASCDNQELFKEVTKFCVNRCPDNVFLYHRQGMVSRIFEKEVVATSDFLETTVDTRQDWKAFNVSSNGSVNVKALTHVNKAIKPGDVSEVGLEISLGKTVEVSAYIYRLVCSNGLTRQTYSMKFVLENSRESLPLFRHEVRKAGELAEGEFIKDYFDTAKIPVPNPAQTVHQLARKTRISSAIEKELLDRAPSMAPGSTYYDLINLFTELARDKEDEGDHRSYAMLQRFADNTVRTIHQRRCGSCLQALQV